MKKSVLIVTILLLLSLVATSPATAKGGPDKAPTWELAFEPGPQMGYGTITYHGVEFRGKLYYNFWWTDTTDQIWGSPDGKSWSLAWDANSIQGGFESLGPMTVFKGQMYLAIGDWDGVYPDQIVRTRDGIHWEPVAWTGLHTDEFGYFFGTFASFPGAIYAAVSYWDQTINKVILLRSTSGDPGTWDEVAQFPDWGGVASYAAFNGALYIQSDGVNVLNPLTLEWEPLPTQILRSYDGVSWEPVNTDGFGDPMNTGGGGLAAYKGYLYAGTGSLDVPGGDIWRSRDGVSWEPVTTDGFGRPANLIMTGFATYKGMLFTYSSSWEGTEVYTSKDGLHWKLINEAGWGDVNNKGVNREHARVVFKGSLYLGIVGPATVMRYGP